MSSGVWIVVILLIIIIIVLPIVPIENCAKLLGYNVACVTERVSIAQLIFGK
ncbi:MAG: hypothetical protein Q7U60_03830 [Candidatus Methanoperedens sp.]|nr:hypothetical protein [Candidatus Methanoperedens sp.]